MQVQETAWLVFVILLGAFIGALFVEILFRYRAKKLYEYFMRNSGTITIDQIIAAQKKFWVWPISKAFDK